MINPFDKGKTPKDLGFHLPGKIDTFTCMISVDQMKVLRNLLDDALSEMMESNPVNEEIQDMYNLVGILDDTIREASGG